MEETKTVLITGSCCLFSVDLPPLQSIRFPAQTPAVWAPPTAFHRLPFALAFLGLVSRGTNRSLESEARHFPHRPAMASASWPSGSSCAQRPHLLRDGPSPRLRLSVVPLPLPLALQSPGMVTVPGLVLGVHLPRWVSLPCPHLCKPSAHSSLW